MYHLLMGHDWNASQDSLPAGRVFEYTANDLIDLFEPDGEFDIEAISDIPAIFSDEYHNGKPTMVRIGSIRTVRRTSNKVSFRYSFVADLPPITNRDLVAMSGDLDIEDWEFSRTHWAIKDVDLFEVLFKYQNPNRIDPKVFRFDDSVAVDDELVALMMPFDGSFDNVSKTIKKVVEKLGLRCQRADDIWIDPAVIQDVFSLIHRSRVVICDCTGRNANVFYETGIAHTLGRDVVLITQSDDDIPFDLKHLRYVRYLDNQEGLKKLSDQLETKLEDVI